MKKKLIIIYRIIIIVTTLILYGMGCGGSDDEGGGGGTSNSGEKKFDMSGKWEFIRLTGDGPSSIVAEIVHDGDSISGKTSASGLNVSGNLSGSIDGSHVYFTITVIKLNIVTGFPETVLYAYSGTVDDSFILCNGIIIEMPGAEVGSFMGSRIEET